MESSITELRNLAAELYSQARDLQSQAAKIEESVKVLMLEDIGRWKPQEDNAGC